MHRHQLLTSRPHATVPTSLQSPLSTLSCSPQVAPGGGLIKPVADTFSQQSVAEGFSPNPSVSPFAALWNCLPTVDLTAKLSNAQLSMHSLWSSLLDSTFDNLLGDPNANGKKTLTFNQNTHVLRPGRPEFDALDLREHDTGVCNGLALLWVREEVQGRSGDDAMRWIQEVTASPSMVTAANSGASHVGPRSRIRIPLVGLISRMQNLQLSGFKTIYDFGDHMTKWGKKHGLLIDYNIRQVSWLLQVLQVKGDNAILFRTPVHSMALSKRNGRYRFFEPNFGTAEFSRVWDLGLFLTRYLNRRNRHLQGGSGDLLALTVRKDPSRPERSKLKMLQSLTCNHQPTENEK